MAFLEAFLLSGRAADLILLIVVLESLFLTVWYLCGKGPAPSRWWSPMLAGAALVLALRIGLTGGPAPLLGLALGVAGIAHLGGYRQRWQR